MKWEAEVGVSKLELFCCEKYSQLENFLKKMMATLLGRGLGNSGIGEPFAAGSKDLWPQTKMLHFLGIRKILKFIN